MMGVRLGPIRSSLIIDGNYCQVRRGKNCVLSVLNVTSIIKHFSTYNWFTWMVSVHTQLFIFASGELAL